MKKMSGLFLVMFLLVGTLGFVVAEEHEDVVPEAKKIGFFEDFGDRIGLAFTFNKELKIERILEMAEKRLAEAELLAEENPEAYAEAQERYDNLVARAEEILASIEENRDGVNGSLSDVEKLVRIQDKFERHRAHADEIYTRVLERFELNNASDEKIERFEMFYERALNRSYEMETRIIEKQGKNIQKYRNLTRADDDEVNRMLVEIEEREGLNESREERRMKAEVRIERVVDAKNNHITRMRFELRNSTLTGEQRARIEIRIRDASGNIDDFEMRIRERFESEDGRFELRIRERFKDGELRTEIRIRDDVTGDDLRAEIRENEDGFGNDLRREEEALKDALRAVEDAIRAEEDALKDALRAEEDAAKAEEDASDNESQ
jgi:hypothetical protein